MNTVKSAQIDYFTITAKLSSAGEVWKRAKMVAQTLELTYTPRPWRFFGYQGFIYSHPIVGHFAYGESSNDLMGVIAQGSGELSARFCSAFFVEASRWSRIDLAVTVELDQADETIAEGYYNYVNNNGYGHRTYSIIKNTLGGSTLYVGSRSSNEFGRIYDKGIESKITPVKGKIWRYEVELKGEKSKIASNQLKIYGDHMDHKSHPIVTTVYDWFNARGCAPIFLRRGQDGLDLVLHAENKSYDQKLVWLRKQVSPTVRDLITLNRTDEVMKALGITDYLDYGPKNIK